MGTLGTIALYGTLLSILATIGFGAQAARTGKESLALLTERATLAIAAFVSLAVLALQMALITLDFSLKYVAEYTSSTLSVLYRVGSMWAGQGGSLLLWAWIIGLTGAWTVRANRRKHLDLSPWVFVVSAVFAGLFAVMATFLQSPFVAASNIADGAGLNPLLQDPLQLIHPLFLYGGYVLFTVPFAVVFGQIIAGRTTGPWIEFARVWAILSWVSLTIGMVLGARWAYAELGWGGYWAWDPVENASLIPWLSGTAVVHTGLTHRGARDRVRMTSVILLAATFNLCLFGTFLTRSGVIQSVHAFGQSNLGPVLGGAIVVSVLACGGILVWRLPQLKYLDEHRHNRGWFGQLVLTVLLIAMTIAVLWGTLYPLFARAFLNQEVAVTPGFFRVVVAPMGVLVLVLLSISPFLPGQRVAAWQREAAIRAVALIAIAGGAYVLGNTIVVSVILALSVLSIWTIIVKARPHLGRAMATESSIRPLAVTHAMAPYLAHVGLVILLAAISVNVTEETKQQVKLAVGKTATVAGHKIKLDSANLVEYADRQALESHLSLLNDDGSVSGGLSVAVQAFNNSDQPHTEVGIKSTLARDIYVVIDGWPDDLSSGVAWLRLSVYDNPAVNWVWFGGGLLGIAGLLYIMPVTRRRRGESVSADPELDRVIDTAILAVNAGIETTANERVNALIASARTITGEHASPAEVVAFLERNRSASSASAASVGVSRNTLIGAGLGIAIIVGAGAYIAGHTSGSAIPGISGTPSNGASASASATTGVDQAQVAALMQKVTANPKDAASYAQLGAIYYSAASDESTAGDQTQALQDFNTALGFFEKRTELAPKDVNAWLDAGATALAVQSMDKALRYLEKAVAIEPKNQMAHFDLGIWYLNANPPQSDKATAEFKTVVAIDPNSDIGKTAAQHVGVTGNSTTAK